ncbi:MAG: ABC transporter ATP-binding protein, partial [Candidatus Woesearchaeota archaeon]
FGNEKYTTYDIGFVTQRDVFYDELTVLENFHYVSKLKKIPDYQERCEGYIFRLGLTKKKNTKAKYLSGGERRRLTIGLGFVTLPKLIIMDEPTTGLDPLTKHQLWQLLLEEKKHGKTILLITHLMDDIEALCDKVLFLKEGKITAYDNPHTLKQLLATSLKLKIKTDKQVSSLLQSIEGVGFSCTRHGQTLLIEGKNSPFAINYLISLINQFGLDIQDVELVKPSMYEIFKEYEGTEQEKALVEEVEEPNP